MSATAAVASPAAPAPAAAPAAPAEAPRSAVPVNATMLADAPAASVPAQVNRLHDASTTAFEAARALDRAERNAAHGHAEAPATETKAEPAAVTPVEPAAKPPEGDKPEPAKTVTARIADLTRRNREIQARAAASEAGRVAAEAKAAAAETAATEARAAMEALRKAPDKLEAIKAAFKADPLAALDQIGEKWGDIVLRVANGGVPPTPEQVAAAEAERAATEKENARLAAEKERDARLAALEAERKAEKDAATARQKTADETESARVAAEQTKGAIAFVASKLIASETHPYLVNIAEDAAQEAIAAVDDAMIEAHKAGKRATPFPTSAEESVKLTKLALQGLNTYYQDLAQRIAPVSAAQQSAATTPAATAATAVIPVVAESQQRRPVGTITHAVAGEMPQAAQPQQSSPEDARARAIEAARRLPLQ